MVKFLTSAQPFGFGPVSKLGSIAAHLDSAEVWFAGHGVALRYARLNGQHLHRIIPLDLADTVRSRRLVRDVDAAISVMEPQLVYIAVRERRPVYFFDSLLHFWSAERPFHELASTARLILTGPESAVESAFRSLSVHESMIVSHMIANRSYAQVFPGVAERIELFHLLGFQHIQGTGSMIDLVEIDRLNQTTVGKSLVANLGGFTNAFLDYKRHGAYIDIIVRWLTRLAAKTHDFDEIVVCSGAFAESYVKQINGVQIRVGMFPHADLLTRLANAPVYLISPGLTSLHEAVALSIAPMLLPDQHYGHTINRCKLAHTSLAALGASFSALDLGYHNIHDDLRGTLVLAEIAARIQDDPVLFDTFANYMDRQLATFLRISPDEARVHVREVKELLSGIPVKTVIAAMAQEVADAAARVAH